MTNETENRKLLRPAEARRLLAIANPKLRSLETKGILRPVFIDGAKRFRQEDINNILHGEGATQAPKL